MRTLDLTLGLRRAPRRAERLPSPGVDASPVQGAEWALGHSAAMIAVDYMELSHSSA
jgi:hypothetical protein